MDTRSKFAPSHAADVDEYPHEISDVPMWSENYLSVGSFPKAQVSMWFHHGRTMFFPDQWQEFVVIYLPGDQYLVSKATAAADDRKGPCAAALTYECIKTFETWTKNFRGAARLVTGDQLRAGALTDGLSIGVDMNMTWNARAPAFKMDLPGLATTHYEQHCNISGSLVYGDKHIELAGSGLRDHSWGPRQFSKVGRHAWMLAQWEDGRSFMIMYLVSADGAHTLNFVSVDDGTGQVIGRLLTEAPLINDIAGGQQGYTLRIELPNKTVVEMTAEIIQVPTLSMVGPSELVVGADQTTDATHWLCEAATRFTWNGSVAIGLTERTVRRKK